MSQNREQWGSKLGFILAASGSAVGIGNIWKYPHMAGQNGGAAFTLVYLACIFVVGLSIVIAEFVIGRKTQLSPVGAFEQLAPSTNWKWVGFLGVASAFVILSFYGVVGGWVLKYVIVSITGGFNELAGDPDAAGNVFNTFITDTWSPIIYQVFFMAFCVWVIVNGVKGGIEKWSKIMMPLIVVLLAVLAVRGMTLPGGMKGISFLFNPRFEDLTANSIVLALGHSFFTVSLGMGTIPRLTVKKECPNAKTMELGHSFFTVSLGMGTMITYGSYLNRKQNLLNAALWVIALDTAIAMLAGIAIFTTVFALGANPAEGPGLIFVVLPSVFPQLAAGTLWGTIFFVLLFMAALTSAISILEVVTAYFIDQKGWSRKKATIQFGAVITVVGVFCSLSMGGGVNITEFLGMTFFDVMDYLSAKYMLPIGGMLTAIFILRKWGISNYMAELKSGMGDTNISSRLVQVVLTIAAAVVAFIIFNEVYAEIFGKALIG